MTRHTRNIPEYVLDNLDRLKEERRKSGLTSGRLAGLLGVTTTTVLHYEEDLMMPQRNIYNRMAKLFGWEVWNNDESKNY